VTDPLRFSFEVACSPERAFELWTTRISLWWPTDHSVSRVAGLEVVLEGRVGGRIYERAPSGEVFEWGTVTGWDEPAMLAYTWHLGGDPDNPTDVVIRFLPASPASPTTSDSSGRTRVEIDHRGWEMLGEVGLQRRENNQRGWDGVLPHFISAAERGEMDGEEDERGEK
jgi:uncharacterized protein YndB with AHSA1/START domain